MKKRMTRIKDKLKELNIPYESSIDSTDNAIVTFNDLEGRKYVFSEKKGNITANCDLIQGDNWRQTDVLLVIEKANRIGRFSSVN